MQALLEGIKHKPVLVVDDAPSMRSLLTAILKGFGISRVYEASNGAEALELLRNKPVELIFCDWEMPKQDGLELFEQLQADEELKQIPFVLVTSMAEMDKVKMAIGKGIENYIVKPFKEDTLMARINDVFSESVEKQV